MHKDQVSKKPCIIKRAAIGIGIRLASIGPKGNPIAGDIDIEGRYVILNKRGMSVAQNPKLLPTHRIPKRLGVYVPLASGSNLYAIWKIEIPFSDRVMVTKDLILRLGSDNHGNICPSLKRTLSKFEQDLEGTQNLWKEADNDITKF
jgi:hypothetical protein